MENQVHLQPFFKRRAPFAACRDHDLPPLMMSAEHPPMSAFPPLTAASSASSSFSSTDGSTIMNFKGMEAVAVSVNLNWTTFACSVCGG